MLSVLLTNLEPPLVPGGGPHGVVDRQPHAPLVVLDERLRGDRVVVALDADSLNLRSTSETRVL